MKNKIRINDQIKVGTIRLINNSGEMLGVVSLLEGLKLAKESGLDLIEISPNAEPPVCKIMSFGKYKYEIQKKTKKQKAVEIKEIKIRPTIADADYGVKLKKAIEFVKKGNKVRISLVFKGREISHNEIGFALVERFKNDVSIVAKVDTPAKIEGKQIYMVIGPK